jgi:hypothetical protein
MPFKITRKTPFQDLSSGIPQGAHPQMNHQLCTITVSFVVPCGMTPPVSISIPKPPHHCDPKDDISPLWPHSGKASPS